MKWKNIIIGVLIFFLVVSFVFNLFLLGVNYIQEEDIELYRAVAFGYKVGLEKYQHMNKVEAGEESYRENWEAIIEDEVIDSFGYTNEEIEYLQEKYNFFDVILTSY